MTTQTQQPPASSVPISAQVGSHCQACMKHLSEKEIKRCARCKSASYCSPACQASSWPTHKLHCVPPQSTEPTAASSPSPPAASSQQSSVPTPDEFKAWSSIHKATLSFAAVDALELATPQGRAQLPHRTLLLFLNHHPEATETGKKFTFQEGEVESFADLASTLPPHLDLLNTRSRLRTDSLALPGSSPTDLFALVVVVSGAEENAQLFVMPLVWKAEELEEMVPVSEVPWREVLEYGIKSGRAVWD